MNLSSILGGVTAAANTAAGLAGTYYQLRALREGRPMAAAQNLAQPPAVNPKPTYRGNAPGLDLGDFTATGIAGNVADLFSSNGGGSVYSRRAQRIAAATGQPVEEVAAILAAGRPRRRRRRMLTKSDIADISTMSALLGKNSESFKTWLAGALRR